MKKLTAASFLCLAIVSLVAFPAFAQEEGSGESPQVVLETSKGAIVLELYPDKAPKTVENFLAYVESGFYDGTIFHRVVRDFVIQGGGFTEDFTKKPTRPPIANEAKNGLTNDRGTISMARTPDPDSATSQFFISTKDNPNLDPGAADPHGYAVFGKVIEGMEVVDAIGAAKTTYKNRMQDVPAETVVITKASLK